MSPLDSQALRKEIVFYHIADRDIRDEKILGAFGEISSISWRWWSRPLILGLMDGGDRGGESGEGPVTWFEEIQAVKPLEPEAAKGMPDTYPFGV